LMVMKTQVQTWSIPVESRTECLRDQCAVCSKRDISRTHLGFCLHLRICDSVQASME
jgi:hypothetical protein